MLKSINENLVMMIAMRPIFLAILLLWPFLGLGTATTATTFELHVDGRATTLGAGALSGALEGPASLADISMGVATDTLHSYCNLTHSRPSLEKMTIDDREQHCFPHSGGRGACCFVNYHHARNDGLFTLQVVIHVSNDFYTRIDVSLTASVDDNVIRQSLVQALPKIRERLTDAKNGDDSSVWFINHRPNAVQIDLTQTHLDAQDDRDKKAASVESVILGNSGMRNRVQLEHTFVDFPNASQSLLELWEYKDLDLKDPVKSLFIDGKLQTTTSPAGTAHAEALVHPAMIAHSIPKDVIIISRTPLAVVREVLKHKSVERVTVFGTDMTALDIVMRSMPVHNDCSFLKTDDPNCVSQAAVEIVDQVDVKEWLSSCRKDVSDNQDSATCYYDVVLLDVPIGRHEWLSPDFHDDLQWLCKEDTVIMVSSGSHPQLSDVTGEIGMNARDMLLYNASRKQSHGGIGYPTVLVFDEVCV
jgi:spermidine synthase